MKNASDFYTKYHVPKTPAGGLLIAPGVFLKFPIEEEQGTTLIAHLNDVVERVYQQGLKNGAEFPIGNSKDFQDDKRIQRVYVKNGELRVAATRPENVTPQFVPRDPDLLADQINGMIDRAEERGCVKGYRACLNDKSHGEPTEDSGDKKIRYAYRDGNSIMVAGIHQATNDPQSINGRHWKNSDMDLYIQQINNMIDRAKRRGNDNGYREGFANGNAGFIRNEKK